MPLFGNGGFLEGKFGDEDGALLAGRPDFLGGGGGGGRRPWKRKPGLVVQTTKQTQIQSPRDVSIPVAFACFMGAGGGGGGIDPPVFLEGAVAVGPPLCSTKFLINS